VAVTVFEYSCSRASIVCGFVQIPLIVFTVFKKKKSLMLQNRALFKCLMSFFSSLCVTSSSACPKDTNAITVALQSPGKPLFTVQEVC